MEGNEKTLFVVIAIEAAFSKIVPLGNFAVPRRIRLDRVFERAVAVDAERADGSAFGTARVPHRHISPRGLQGLWSGPLRRVRVSTRSHTRRTIAGIDLTPKVTMTASGWVGIQSPGGLLSVPCNRHRDRAELDSIRDFRRVGDHCGLGDCSERAGRASIRRNSYCRCRCERRRQRDGAVPSSHRSTFRHSGWHGSRAAPEARGLCSKPAIDRSSPTSSNTVR